MVGVLLAFSLSVCALVAGLVFVIARRFHWSNLQHAMIGTLSVILTIIGLFFALIFGFLEPIEAYSMQWKLDALERHLYVGESRADIESLFGHSVPKPDSLSSYSVSAAEAVPGWSDHLGSYSYESGGAFCVQGFRGIVVFYDVHDRVKSWKHFDSAVGC